MHELLAPTGVLAHLSASHVAVLTGKTFFPQLISGPFHHGLVIVFSMAMAVLVIAAGASALRGGRYVHDELAAGAAQLASGSSAETEAAAVTEMEAAAEVQAAAGPDAAAQAGSVRGRAGGDRPQDAQSLSRRP